MYRVQVQLEDHLTFPEPVAVEADLEVRPQRLERRRTVELAALQAALQQPQAAAARLASRTRPTAQMARRATARNAEPAAAVAAEIMPGQVLTAATAALPEAGEAGEAAGPARAAMAARAQPGAAS